MHSSIGFSCPPRRREGGVPAAVELHQWSYQVGRPLVLRDFVKCFLRVGLYCWAVLLGCTVATLLPQQARGTFKKFTTKPYHLVCPSEGLSLTKLWLILNYELRCDVPGGAAICSEGFVVNVLKVPLACWGSMSAAVQPNSLGNSKKTFYKTSQNKWPPHLVLILKCNS